MVSKEKQNEKKKLSFVYHETCYMKDKLTINEEHNVLLRKYNIINLIIRGTITPICELPTTPKSFRRYPYKEIIKP